MKKIIFLLLISFSSFSQSKTKFYAFEYPDKLSEKVKIESIPEKLLDFPMEYDYGKKQRGTWTFVSLSEYEEVRGGKVFKSDVRYYYPVTILAHDYSDEKSKFMIRCTLVFIDSREGLKHDTTEAIIVTKI